MVINKYLTKNLDCFLDLSVTLKRYRDRFVSELINSSLLIAHDENIIPITLILDSEKYGFIFTDVEEFKKAFPDASSSSLDFEFSTLKEILNDFKMDGFILNVSTQNIYLTKKFINNLNDLPSNILDCSDAYSAEELQSLKDSLNNGKVEDFIKNSGNFIQLLKIISSNPLFGLMVCDNDMSIIECDGVIDTFGLTDKYDFYNQNQHVALFTDESRLKNVKTDKFKYLSLVDLSVVAHYSIKHELGGIAINPCDENYMIPTEILVEHWPLINRMCYNKRLISGKRYLFTFD
ncbi:SseB family protein [uncultured Methanobrevibacter sp.]|uniref:SseB family protein n=1 Tax=uncultured Methanobrevibacter sp. TaxID=253161 RepID=UPI00261EC9BF|nr:SseB family protein [uncultured Methanobrevibacter sp.]